MINNLKLCFFLIFFSGTAVASQSSSALPGGMSAAQYFTTVAKIAGFCESTAYLAEFREDDQSRNMEEFRLAFFDFMAEKKGLDRAGLIKACSKAAKEWKAISDEIAPK